jgi:hypothetical protein
MITEKGTSKAPTQMVWGSIWITPNGCVGTSPLIIMERDTSAKCNSYTAQSYCDTLEEGLLLQYLPGQIFMQDKAILTSEFLMDHRIHTIDWPPTHQTSTQIEHLWWALKKMVHKLHPELNTIRRSEADGINFARH